MLRPPTISTLFPYTTLFRSLDAVALVEQHALVVGVAGVGALELPDRVGLAGAVVGHDHDEVGRELLDEDRKSTRLNSSHVAISYAVFCLKKKKTEKSYS